MTELPDNETLAEHFARLGIELIEDGSRETRIVFGGAGLAKALIARGIGTVKHVTLDESE